MIDLIDLTESINATPVPTRADTITQAEAENWPQPAQELLCRSTAQERHQSRVARCFQVARAVALAIDPQEQRDGEIAHLLCLAGWQGVGGPLGLGAEAPGGTRTSQRIWPWRSHVCGKGRANASDGPAWCQALYGAQTQVAHEVTGDYYVPSGYVAAFEVVLEWAGEDPERTAWAAELQQHLQAIAGRRVLNAWDPWRALWAEVYSACVSPFGATAPMPVQDAQALRIRLRRAEE
ncbi:MAG: hypothetical protein GX934_03080 [Burkholderiales bacterium]|nr:hypothetical protein [Burkholderiales bacterium]